MDFVTYEHINLWKLIFVLEDILAVSYDDLSFWIELFFWLLWIEPCRKACHLALIKPVVNQVFIELNDKLLVGD